MRTNKTVFFILLAVILLSACSKKSVSLEKALLTAGENRVELEKVLAHYQEDPADSLKYRAACFLIENMVGKYYIDGRAIQEKHHYMDSLFQIIADEYDYIGIDSAYLQDRKEHESDYSTYRDLQTLSAGYIIYNIEQAFDVWERPWAKEVPFDLFCEYVLPHRIGNEVPEQWRGIYRNKFEKILLDSAVTNPIDAAILIGNKLKEPSVHIENLALIPKDIRPGTLINIKFGRCENYANLAVLAMRSVGIPASIEFVPHWGKGSENHTSNVVFDINGKGFDFMGGEENPGEGHLKRFDDYPKIYRRTYSVQKKSLSSICEKEKIPPVFRDPCIQDVTGMYPFINAQNITIDLPEKLDNRFAYLSVFDRSGWFPVGWCKIKKGQAAFSHIGPNIVYQVTLYDKERIIPVEGPFWVDSLGDVHKLKPEREKITLELDRKYRPNTTLKKISSDMIGGRFQASDYKDFYSVEDLHVFTDTIEDKYVTIEVTPSKAYKYYRYLSSDRTPNNMAEVEFYQSGSNEVLKGGIIGTEGASIYYPRNTKEKVFDGDPLTFYHSKDPFSWVGMVFNNPVVVNKIRYIRRNDDNGIRKSNLYELLYNENGYWISLEKKEADMDDIITFENIPSGCLYWLRNHTRGKEERPFTYENNKQVWW